MIVNLHISPSENAYYIEYVESSVVIKITENEVKQVETIAKDCQEAVWEATLYSWFENLRDNSAFVETLYYLCELKTNGC